MNSMLIGRAFCRLLAVGRLLHSKFCWFWLFLRDFHFFDNQGHPKRPPHWRLEIKEVSEQGGSDPTRSTRLTHLENCHHWRRPSCNETDMQQWCQFQEPVRPLIAMALSVYSVMVTISSHLNLNFLKGSVPKNSVSSQHSRQSKKYKTEQPFVSGVKATYRRLGCLNVEQRVNNFKRV